VSATCPSPYAVGVVCRAAAGGCDVAESCTGADVNCPPDAVEGAGTVCRASTAMCDPAEDCDGTSTVCPLDVTHCAAADGGNTDAGAHGTDAAASMADTGVASIATNGSCGCRMARPAGTVSWALVGLALLIVRRLVRA